MDAGAGQGGAIGAYRRQWLLEETNAAYAALRANPEKWEQELLTERREWEATIGDDPDQDGD